MIKRLLIIVKTYPTPNRQYQETVCTAGVDEDGYWYRLYPIRFRTKNFDQQFKKWQWIEIDVLKNLSDFRPESYSLVNLDIPVKLGTVIEPDSSVRKELLLKRGFYTDLDKLISDSRKNRLSVSLAVYKPQVMSVTYSKCDKDWPDEIVYKMSQLDIFTDWDKKPLRRLPHNFALKCKDINGQQSRLKILDWEIGALYWKCIDNGDDDATSVRKVKDKLQWMIDERDLYLILGSTFSFHNWETKNPFTIVGLFYPKRDDQITILL